ncbi:MAG: nucleotide exchange factor GrpE [Planctomycetes bacterium]|nr:nucleotide exchange factor GrpE [Planctomycetota bacterium]
MSSSQQHDANPSNGTENAPSFEDSEVPPLTPEKAEGDFDAPIDDPQEPEDKDMAITRLNAELEEERNRFLRAHAEMANYRKRQEKDRQQLTQLNIRDVVAPMLDPIDNLQRTLDAIEGSVECTKEHMDTLTTGIKMVLEQWSESLTKRNVEEINPLGQKFDPNLHEAYGQIETEDYPVGHVAAVFRKGYKVGDTLIRTATVQVAKAPQAEE